MSDNKSSYVSGSIKIILLVCVFALLFFLSAGTLQWPEAWVLLLLWTFYFSFMFIYGKKKSPGVIQERVESINNFQKKWDSFLIRIYIVFLLGMLIVSGFDVGRYHWSEVPLVVKVVIFFPVLVAYFIPIWAIMSNPFTSAVVRIQEERGHEVVSTGPYAFIRHPMYLNTVLFGLTAPIFLGSWWAVIPGAFIALIFIIRTALEDRTLQVELPGYKKYTQKVKYRLFPGIW
jgi:protein-S-isoprenylcysteine O-methyltransferase Ste14